MKKMFVKSLIVFMILFCLLNYLNMSSHSAVSILKMLAISILCSLPLAGLTVLLKINFLKSNKRKLKDNKKRKKNSKK
ncbi:MAG TPA: hypothetical protein DC034_10335 [Clostridium sp.]|jgi:predicted membrane protein|uniref:DUF1049 domain-containing protein n=1 Tax=Clostridium lapidicellarium TaxID=3240931 RepID=A0ABV4DZ02_9CLOT|nr:hypothetical protein [uncultured Clostridium sp.]NLU06839.1 hypothetical protein [Clostridiales bacterium]HBC97178.1 hypothetical protein [Clostridium sp.]